MPTAPCLFVQCYQKPSGLGFFYSLNAELSGDLVMEAKPQCKGRPAATGRVLQRIVNLESFEEPRR